MRKLSAALSLILALIICFSACGKSSNPGDLVVKAPYEINTYLTLGKYKGLQVTLSTSSEVTDQDLKNAIDLQLLKNATGTNVITDRAVQKWDTVNIDYEGLLDSVAFDGGTATGQDLTIGSGSFIDGFEDGLIGAQIGETRAVNATFPTVYKNNPDLAGKTVVFNVKINSITENIFPDYTDAYVKSTYGYDSISEYEKSYLEQLKTERLDTIESEKEELVWAQVVANSTVKSYPQDVYDSYYNEIYSYYENMASQYSMTIDSLVSYYSMTMDEFEAKLKSQVQEQIQNEMISYAVLIDAKVNISADEQSGYKNDLLQANSFQDEAEFESSYGKTFEEAYGTDKLQSYYITAKASAYCASLAKVVE